MIGRAVWLTRSPTVFRAVIGITVAEYRQIVAELAEPYAVAKRARRARPDRRRAPGGGRRFTLSLADQVLLTIIWLRQYPTFPVLGYLFGLADRPASRIVARLLPLSEAAGRDSMRLPDPGPYHRRDLPLLLLNTPGLLVVVDTFEQRVQRPADHAEQRQWYSGKQQAHTTNVPVGVAAATGQIVDVADSVPWPTAAISVRKNSGLCGRLPPGTGLMPTRVSTRSIRKATAPGRNPGGSRARTRTACTIGRSPAAASSSSTTSASLAFARTSSRCPSAAIVLSSITNAVTMKSSSMRPPGVRPVPKQHHSPPGAHARQTSGSRRN